MCTLFKSKLLLNLRWMNLLRNAFLTIGCKSGWYTPYTSFQIFFKTWRRSSKLPTIPSPWANAHGGRALRPWVGSATLPHPYKPIGILLHPPPRNLLSLYQELGPTKHFPLASRPRSPQHLQTIITSLYNI